MDALFAGIPQAGIYLGSQTAPVTLQYFNDVSCPASREIMMGPLAAIIRTWVRSGRLRIEFESVNEPPSESGVGFAAQQAAALAAGEQDKLWSYLYYYYRAIAALGSNYSDDCNPPFAGLAQWVARRVPGLSFARWNKEQSSARLVREVAASLRTAIHDGFGRERPTPVAEYPNYSNPGYLIGPTGAHAVTLPRFARTHHAYTPLLHELFEAKVQGG